MVASKRITLAIRQQMKREIIDNDGHEALWYGLADEDGWIYEAHCVARGDVEEVPVLFPHAEKGDVIIHNHPSGIIVPSKPDLNIAALLGNKGIGFFIVDNDLKTLKIVTEPIEKKTIAFLDIEETTAVLRPEGKLSNHFEGYEPRESQIKMMESVAEGFNTNAIVAAEAGTGVGKSFAYLFPALMWAYKNEERIVISTGTINLQQQLLEKDIVTVCEVLGISLNAVLVKGRQNYLCLRRMNEAAGADSLFSEDNDQLETIEKWSRNTATGEKSDLSFYPSDALWNKVCCEGDNCFTTHCPHFPHCFLKKARINSAQAKVLVVNHHLLFAEIMLRKEGAEPGSTLLPHFERIIFDEAHKLEQSATSFFSSSFSKFSLTKYFNRLLGNRRGQKGCLTSLDLLAEEYDTKGSIPHRITKIEQELEVIDQLTERVLANEYSLRLVEVNNDIREDLIRKPLMSILTELRKIDGVLNQMVEALPDSAFDSLELKQCRMARSALQSIAGFCSDYIAPQIENPGETTDAVLWIDKRKIISKNEFFPQLIITPLDIQKLMNEYIFNVFDTVILTSATLTINYRFKYWFNRIGLSDEQRNKERTLLSHHFPSPFPYKTNVLLAVPDDAPDVTNAAAFRQFGMSFIEEAIRRIHGGVLVLFTANAMLRDFHEEIAENLLKEGLAVYKQGEEDRTKLLNRFKKENSASLFATSSFWEGVDIPGDTLQMVIICRLPFQVPTDPVIKARLERIEKQGKNPFMEFSLPESIVKFRQGFGRLIRRSDDRGAVVVLDNRIIKKKYGQYFFNSIPETERIVSHSKTVLDKIEQFITLPLGEPGLDGK